MNVAIISQKLNNFDNYLLLKVNEISSKDGYLNGCKLELIGITDFIHHCEIFKSTINLIKNIEF